MIYFFVFSYFPDIFRVYYSVIRGANLYVDFVFYLCYNIFEFQTVKHCLALLTLGSNARHHLI